MAAPKLTMHYFALPGRAEAARIIAQWGGLHMEDKIYGAGEGMASWPEFKAKTPYGQLPVLEVDGQYLAQSMVIEEYLGELVGLVPKGSALERAQARSVGHFLADMYALLTPTFAIKDLEERTKARQELCAGPLKAKLEQLNSIVEANGGWATKGGAVTYVDIAIFSQLSQLAAGWMDGVPPTLLNDHPALKAFHARIAALEPIRKRYEGVTEGVRLAFKQLPA